MDNQQNVNDGSSSTGNFPNNGLQPNVVDTSSLGFNNPLVANHQFIPTMPTVPMMLEPNASSLNHYAHPNMVYPETLLAVSNMVRNPLVTSAQSSSEGGANVLQIPPIPAPVIVGAPMGLMPPPQAENFISTSATSGTEQDTDFSQIFSLQNESMNIAPLQASLTTLGGVPIPPFPPNSTATQVQMAAAAAAAAAVPPKMLASSTGSNGQINMNATQTTAASTATNTTVENPKIATAAKKCPTSSKRKGTNAEMTAEERKKINRDRNRQHARSTRLRKKAYIEKLKQLVDGLHAERSEQDRKRRVAVQHLAEVHRVRRTVIKSFLQFHSGYESDSRKWMTILEDDFYLKQPVTPYRSFRRVEIELSQERECRRSRGIEAMIGDAASMAVMVESVGSRSARWANIKREEFLSHEEKKTGAIRQMPSMVRQSVGPTVSSLSSGSRGSSGHGSSSEEERRQQQGNNTGTPSTISGKKKSIMKKVSASSSSVGGSSHSNNRAQASNNDYHDYHAQPLPDPKLVDSGGSSGDSDSPTESRNGSDIAVVARKHVCTDSSSSDEERSTSHIETKNHCLNSQSLPSPAERNNPSHPSKNTSPSRKSSISTSQTSNANVQVTISDSANSQPLAKRPRLPANIAHSGGISHNIRPVAEANLNSRLSAAPLIPLPPFVGIGKRANPTTTIGGVKTGTAQPTVSSSSGSILAQGTAVSTIPQQDSSSSSLKGLGGSGDDKRRIIPSSSQNVTNLIGAYNDNCSEESAFPKIQAYYHVNEDDMLLTDDVLMCPFIFRTQDAVPCGALAECVMPGMLRAQFSDRNKLMSLEMVYDAMGFMQQLQRGSGNEGTAQIIPNSLEMAIQPTNDARVITMAKPPFRIVSVNEAWTQTTKYTQMEVEGNELSMLHGKRTNLELSKRPGKPLHDMNEVAKGRPACAVDVYYDKKGSEFITFVCSLPLTNSEDKVTHILHTFKELPKSTVVEFLDVS